MQIKNTLIFSSTLAADGAWQDVSNLVSLSVQVVNLEGKVWIEVSNDPNIQSDGANGQLAAPSAPTVSQFTPTQSPLGVSGLPAQALSIKVTYTTRNQPVISPTPLYSYVVGETLPSTATALSVLANNIGVVNSPAKDAAGIATGYNVYAQIGGSGAYVLQNTRGGPNASNDQFVYDGPIPLGTPFQLKVGYFDSGVAAPVADTSGGPGVGVNLQGSGGNLVGATSVFDANPVIMADASNGAEVMVSPSSLAWKWLRVRKDNTTQTKQTNAWICGGMG